MAGKIYLFFFSTRKKGFFREQFSKIGSFGRKKEIYRFDKKLIRKFFWIIEKKIFTEVPWIKDLYLFQRPRGRFKNYKLKFMKIKSTRVHVREQTRKKEKKKVIEPQIRNKETKPIEKKSTHAESRTKDLYVNIPPCPPQFSISYLNQIPRPKLGAKIAKALKGKKENRRRGEKDKANSSRPQRRNAP